MSDLGRAMPEPTFGGVMSPLNPPAWFAVRTRPRHEKQVALELKEKGVEVFLPLLQAVHQWSDRRRRVELPLFSSYLFVRLHDERNQRLHVLRTQGALGFVGMRGTGVEVPNHEIEAIEVLLRERIAFTACPFLNIGQRVRVRGGSLDGLCGILVAVNQNQSLVVSVESIQRSLQFRIEGYNLEAA